MEAAKCSRCGRDLAFEEIRYEGEHGEKLCEHCFRNAGSTSRIRPEGFVALRAVAVLLKVVAVIVLAGSIALAHFRFGYGRLLALETALSGIVIFFVCITVSEMIRLGLSVEKKLGHLADAIDFLSTLVKTMKADTHVSSGKDDGASFWQR
jgi:hypothetical protein